MTNFALVLLTFTFSAEGASASAAENASTPADAATAPSAPATPAETAPAPAAPVAPPAAPVAKPSESDVETLSEVPDLQETEDPAAGWYGKAFPEPVRILALPTARTVRKGGLTSSSITARPRPSTTKTAIIPGPTWGTTFSASTAPSRSVSVYATV
jgi:hypothetical protein